MPSIEIDMSGRISRHLAAVRLMSHMVYPDDARLRGASEITFRTILAGWYSGALAKQDRKPDSYAGSVQNWAKIYLTHQSGWVRIDIVTTTNHTLAWKSARLSPECRERCGRGRG